MEKILETIRGRAGALALAALLAGACAIGFAPILVRLSDVDPSAIGFWRVTLALPFFLVWQARQGGVSDRPKLARLSDFRVLILGGAFFALDLAFWHWSIQFTTVANATLLSNLAPVVVAVGAVALFGERFRGTFWLGLVLSVAGAAALAGGSLGEGRLLGDFFAVVTALFYGAYLLTVGRLRRRFRTATVMIWTGAISGLFLAPISLATETVFFPGDAAGWLVLAALAFFCQFLGQGLIAFALAHLPAAFGAVALLLQPVVAAAAAWVLFGEILGGYDYAGAAAILTGIVLARFGTEKRRS